MTHASPVVPESDLLQLFVKYGAEDPVAVAHDTSADEAVFLVTEADAARLSEPALTRRLQNLLQRKVWITPWRASWESRSRPLAAASVANAAPGTGKTARLLRIIRTLDGYHWLLVSPNGRVVAASRHPYTSRQTASRAAQTAKRLMSGAKI